MFNNRMKVPIERVVYKIHFSFLYVFMYSILRNAHRMDNSDDPVIPFIKYLTGSFFIWYLFVTLFGSLKANAKPWGTEDYLATPVLVASVIVIAVLEYFVYV